MPRRKVVRIVLEWLTQTTERHVLSRSFTQRLLVEEVRCREIFHGESQRLEERDLFVVLASQAPHAVVDEKLANLDQFWPGSGNDADKKKVRNQLRTWTTTTGKDKTREFLELFTFGEMKSFLEEIASGKNLRESIEKIDLAEFRRTVREWGSKYITLRERVGRKRNPVYKEYLEDRKLSRIQ